MEPTTPTTPPDGLEQRAAEKVVQPLAPVPTVAPTIIAPTVTPVAAQPIQTVDLSSVTDSGFATLPSRSGKISDDNAVKRVAARHHSVAILGVYLLVIAVIDGIAIKRAENILRTIHNDALAARIQQSITTHEITTFMVVAAGLYLLLTRNLGGVTLLLKIMVIIDFFGVFGIFFGGGASRASDLVIGGILLLYTYITYQVVKSKPLM